MKLKYGTYPLRSITHYNSNVFFRMKLHNKVRGGAYQLMGSMYKMKDIVY